MTRPLPPKTTRPYRYVAVGFGGIALVLLGAIAYLAFARATITLRIEPKPITTTFSITVSADPTVERAIAGQYLTTTVEGSMPVIVSTTSESPARASGTVRILNTLGRSQPLALSTRLLSESGVLFRTTRRVEVPAGGSVEVAVEADQPGKDGEIGPSHFTLPGLRAENQKLVYGTSSAAMAGGTTLASVASEADLTQAKTTLTAELLAKALAQFTEQTREQQPPLTVSIVNQTVTSAAKQPAQAVTLQLSITAVAYDAAGLNARIREELQASVRNGEQITDIAPDHPLTVRSSDAATKSAVLTVTASGTARLTSASPSLAASQFTAQTRAAVTETAEKIPGVRETSVKLFPFWASRTPRTAEKIRIVIKENS